MIEVIIRKAVKSVILGTMTRLFFLFFVAIVAFPKSSLTAKDNAIISAKYNVRGNCEQCKKRIETAAYLKGVRYADWDVDSKILSLKYDSTKTSVSVILQSVAKSGHDADTFVAKDEDYNRLPKCCKYRTTSTKH